MALMRIILWLGYSLLLCAGLSGITVLMSLSLGDLQAVMQYGMMGCSLLALGFVFIILTHNAVTQESKTEALLFLILFWSCIPVITAIPFLFSGTTPDLPTAYFESVAAFTTTGASTLDADSLPKTLLFWRSLLQWAGGVMAATFAAVILASLNFTDMSIHRSFLFTFKKGEIFAHLFSIGRIVACLYALIAGLCFGGLVISGTPAFDSLCLALTSVSTGGLTPRSEVLSAYVNGFGITVLALSCLLGAMSIVIVWDVIRLRTRDQAFKLLTYVEHRGLWVLTGMIVLIGFLFMGIDHLPVVFFETLFLVSSTGYDYDIFGIEMLPIGVLMAVTLIGGSALSTAGGVKIIRMLLLFRHVATDMKRLTHPSRVIPIQFRQQVIPDKSFLVIWMYFLSYTLVLGATIMILGLTGLTLDLAAISSAAALANMGPLLDIAWLDISYIDFDTRQLTWLSVAMLLGRIEILAAFAIFSPAIWRQ